MKNLLIIFFFPLVLQAQQLKPGLWVNVKTELSDGARFIDTSAKSKGFTKYNFFDDGSVLIAADPLFYNLKVKYSLSGDVLKIGFINYQVEKLTADSLVIHEGNITPERFRRYYYVKAGLARNCGSPVYDAKLNDSVYTCNNYLFPQLNATSTAVLSEVNHSHGNGSLRLSFIITKDGKLTDFKIIENKNLGKGSVSDLTKALHSQDIEWIPASIGNKNVNALVEMVFNIGIGKYDVGFSFDYPFIKILN